MSSPPPALSAVGSPAAVEPNQRLVSLDALRGFDMFWILGGDAAIIALGEMIPVAPAHWLADQFDHKPWAGMTFYDLIFPLFVFIAGVSTVFSLERARERRGMKGEVTRVLRRGALLLALGIFYNGGISRAWPDVRLLGVLPRIALVYTATGLLYCFLKPRSLAVVTVLLLGGYWALMTFVPIRDIQLEKSALVARFGTDKPTMEQVRQAFEQTTARVTGKFDTGYNLSNHLDFAYLGGRKYDTYWDPEGLLSTLPAIATCLLGVFAGLLLRRIDLDAQQKLRVLIWSAIALWVFGWSWHLQFPVIKKIWTSSYVLVAGGWSLMLLAIFYWLVDIKRWRGWCRPFVWIGMNPITLFVISGLASYRGMATRLAGGDIRAWFDASIGKGAGGFVISCVSIGLMLALARFLHRREIFLRL